jgi:hypothetical protein
MRRTQQRGLSRPRSAASEILGGATHLWLGYRTGAGIELPRPVILVGWGGGGVAFFSFLPGFGLCPFAGSCFGHIFIAFAVSGDGLNHHTITV